MESDPKDLNIIETIISQDDIPNTEAILSSVDLGGTEVDEIEIITFTHYARNFCVYEIAEKGLETFSCILRNEYDHLDNEIIDTKAIQSIQIDHLIKLLQRKITTYTNSKEISTRVIFYDNFITHAEPIGFENTKKLIFPLINDIFHQEYQVISSFFENYPTIIDYIIKASPEGYEIIKKEFVPLINNSYETQKNEGVIRFTTNALIATAKMFKTEDQDAYIIPIILRQANNDNNVLNQKAAMNAFSQLGPLINSEIYNHCIIPQIISFAESPNILLKQAVIDNLILVSKSINKQSFETKIIKLYLRLSKDSLPEIRRLTCEILLDIAKECSEEIINTKLYDIYFAFMNDSNNIVNYTALTIFGQFITILKEEKRTEELLDFYIGKIKQYYNTKDASIDDYKIFRAAFAFPSVLLEYKDKWPQLKEIYILFSNDKEPLVKRTIANSFEEIVKIISPDIVENDLLDIYNNIMKNNGLDIKNIMLKMLPILIKTIQSDEKKVLLLENLKFMSSHNEKWRNKKKYAVILKQLKGLFNDEIIYTQLLPILLNQCFDHVTMLRIKSASCASHIFCQLLSSPEKEKHQKKILEIIHCFATCLNYHYRKLSLSFIKRIMIEHRDLFNEKIYDYVANLAFDKVLNVRITLAMFISKQWTKHDWISKDERWIQIVNTLKKDSIADVRDQLINIIPSTTNELQQRNNVNEKFTNKMEYLLIELRIKIIDLGINEGNRQIEGKTTSFGTGVSP